VRSRDNGATWEDLGFVLTAPDDSLDCQALNGYFAGGHGDFSVALDAPGSGSTSSSAAMPVTSAGKASPSRG
jgi:hypothetical protein